MLQSGSPYHNNNNNMFLPRPIVNTAVSHFERMRCFCSSKTYKRKRFEKHHKRKDRPSQPFPLPHIQGDILHGIHPAAAALHRQQREIYTAFFKNEVDNRRIDCLREICADKGIPMLEVPGDVLDQMTEDRPHQGVCLDVSPLIIDVLTDSDISLNTMNTMCGKPELWLLPYQIKDAMNMGAVLRSAYFFGVKQVLLPYRNSADLSPVVSKASSGALEMLKVKRFKSGTHLNDTLQRWRELGGIVAGSCSDPGNNKGLNVNNFNMEKPTILIMGNESHGLPQHITSICDTLLHIEGQDSGLSMRDMEEFRVDSLNVSAATAILLHTLLKSR